MKHPKVKAYHTMSLEKDDKKNPTGLQLRIWHLNNGLTILVRFYVPVKKDRSWDALPAKLKRSRPVADGQSFDESDGVPNNILRVLKELGVVNNTDNWAYSSRLRDALEQHDEARKDVGSGTFFYLAYEVRPSVRDHIRGL